MHGGRERGGQPNVVYIDCHDLGDWLACYGRPWLDTPHLDGLAAQGARFGEHIAAAPICMPSRAAIYTGLMPHQLGVTGQEALLLRDDAPPLAARFRAAGYRTVLCGRLMVLNDPAQMGFGEQLECDRDEQAATAAAFLEEAGAGNAPFLLSVSFTQCHRPFGDRHDPEVAERVEVPPYLPDTAATRRDLATLAWQIRDLDAARSACILAAVDRAGLRETTPWSCSRPSTARPMARAKHTIYDSGLRTALLMRLPGAIAPAARTVDEHVEQRRPAAHPDRAVRPARTRHRRHQLGPAPHRRQHPHAPPVRVQRVQLGAAQRRLVLHAESGDPRPALQTDPRLPAHPDLRGFRLAGALRRRPRNGGALLRRAAAGRPAVRPAR